MPPTSGEQDGRQASTAVAGDVRRAPGGLEHGQELFARRLFVPFPIGGDEDFDRDAFLSALKTYLERRQLEIDWETAEAAPREALVNSLSMALPFEPAEKQALLESLALEDRIEVLTALMRIDAAEIGDGDTPTAMQ